MKKTNKIFMGISIFFIGFMAVGVYVLKPAKRVGPEIKPIELAAYDVKGLKSAEQSAALRTKVMKMDGVTACAVNTEAQLASVTFYPDVTDEQKIQLAMNFEGAHATGKHQYPVNVKGECPVNGVQSFLDKMLN